MSANDKLAATFGPGRTTPTPTLETQIAEVLAAHQVGARLGGYEVDFICLCGAEVVAPFAAHQAAVLAPVIREQLAEAYEKGHLDGGTHQYFDGMYPRNPNPYRSNDE